MKLLNTTCSIQNSAVLCLAVDETVQHFGPVTSTASNDSGLRGGQKPEELTAIAVSCGEQNERDIESLPNSTPVVDIITDIYVSASDYS